MLRIVVVARHEGLEPSSEAVDGRIEGRVVLVREHDVEVPVELACRHLSQGTADEGHAYQVALTALLAVLVVGRRTWPDEVRPPWD